MSLVISLHSIDTDITAHYSSDRGLPSPPAVAFLRSVAEQRKVHLCDQLSRNAGTEHTAQEIWTHFYGVGSVSVDCSLVHYQYMKANDSSSYAILCSSKDNLTLRWSVQNVLVNVKSEMTEIGRPASVVCIYENQDKKKYPE